MRKVIAKRHVGTENYVLVEGNNRREVHESSIPGFPALWLTYPNGGLSKVVVGAYGPGGEDALTVLLKEGL